MLIAETIAKSLEELSAILMDKAVEYARTHRHPELRGKTVFAAFEEERPKLVPVRNCFDGFHTTAVSVSRTYLVRFDNNKYAVVSRAVGRPAEICAYADQIVIKQDDTVIAEHVRCFGRQQTMYDPWRHVPVLARKPGALRNGAPFKDWMLSAALERHELAKNSLKTPKNRPFGPVLDVREHMDGAQKRTRTSTPCGTRT